MREALDRVRFRLDRACVTPGWKALFSDANVHIGAARDSDHNPLTVSMQGDEGIALKPKKLFCFKAMWVGADGCEGTIRHSWSCDRTCPAGERVMECILNTWVGLLDWVQISFGRIKDKVKDIEEHLDQLAKGPINSETAQRRVVLRKEL
ncbi:UNVERIFIED_CONTAM: hypothetical protein Sindi_2308900 [Sesamum indicum]